MKKKKAPESYWNYRVMATLQKHPLAKKDPKKFKDQLTLGIHEVYYTKGKPDKYSTDPIAPYGEEFGNIRWAINKMKEALAKPILWTGKKFPKVYKP